MDTITYTPPVDKLLTYGEPEIVDTHDEWPNYLELGFGPEHIPDLIRLATNTGLRDEDSDSDIPEAWAPIHAWRTLGQLHAEAAIEPLVAHFDEFTGDDWASEELSEVFGMIGPAAIPALAAFLNDKSHKAFARIDAIGALEEIARVYPDVKAECVAIFTQQLELFEENDPEVNAFLIVALTHLKVVEAAPLIEHALASGNVETFVTGGWDDVQVRLGLKEREERPLSQLGNQFGTSTAPIAHEEMSLQPSQRSGKRSSTKKAKGRMVKQSRKKNRRKKR